ncbi:5283_t:CDS:1 [Funneliformis geosporum]|uniref:5283_t:CDS:1 n=1 Tax=Funneliformis geosporum TaxID=1117311 RepID=A0A9W4SL43_9GLOM|nr:5283_t:CDS:1 [Funneliformis geosporum]
MTRLKVNEVSTKHIQQPNKSLIINQEQPAKIISCEIKKGKLITQLDDGREVIIAVNLLTKYGILEEDTKPEQLKRYELQNEGRYIHFPETDEILPARIISKGIFASCEESREE